MKIQYLFIVLLLFISACSGAYGTAPTTPTSQLVVSQPTSSSVSQPAPTPRATASSSVPTQNSPSLETTGCSPALIPAVFFSDNERLLGFRDIRIQIYNIKTHLIEVQIQMPTDVVKAALSPDGLTIAVAMDDFSIQIVRLSDQKVIQTLNAHTGTISGLSFSPTGERLLSASEDTWIRVWSLDGKELESFQPLAGGDLPSAIMGIGVSPDWKMVATIPFDGLMNLWSLPDHKLLGSFEGSILGGYSGSQAAFSPDGQFLAQHLGAGGGNISLWRISDEKLLLRGENITTGIDFSLDGRFLAYGEMLPAGGGHVVLRTPNGSQLIRELIGPVGSAPGLPLFTPDGNTLVAMDYASGALLAWNTTSAQLLSLGEVSCPDG